MFAGIFKSYFEIYLAFTHTGALSGYQKAVMWFGIADIWITIIICLLGVIGGIKVNFIMLIILIGMMVISMGLNMFLFIVSVNWQNSYLVDIDNTCRGLSSQQYIIGNISLVYNKNLAKYFCSADCPCQANAGDFAIDNMITDTKGENRIDQCSDYKSQYNIPPNADAIAIVNYMESKWNCSGLCRNEPYYYFSDVNKGPPTKNCRMQLEDTIISEFTVCDIVAFIIFILLLVCVISTILLLTLSLEEKLSLSHQFERIPNEGEHV